MPKLLRDLCGALWACMVFIAVCALIWGVAWAVRADPAPLGNPCSIGPCRVSGAAVAVTIPLPIKPGTFAGKLVLLPLFDKAHRPVTRDGRTLWAVQRPFAYRTHAGDVITLQPGMITDLASIPRFVSPLLAPDGPWVQIAVFHDMLYETSGTGIVWKGHPSALSRATPYTRDEADNLLHDGMGDLGIPDWQTWTIYQGVHFGGKSGWGS